MLAAKKCLRSACQAVFSEGSTALASAVRSSAAKARKASTCGLRPVACASSIPAAPRTQRSPGLVQASSRTYWVAFTSEYRSSRWHDRCLPGRSAAYSTTSPAARAAADTKAQTSPRRPPRITLSNLRPSGRKYRKRRARGGGDKQAGRGYNGQKSRSGTGKPALFFEGGQTPFWKMLPKRGFHNRFRCVYDNVLLAELEAAIRCGRLDPTRVITVKHLYDAGLLEKKAYNRNGVQILAKQPSPWKRARLRARGAALPPAFTMTVPVDLEVQRVSEPARAQIEAAGGRVRRTYYNKLGMRAVLLPEWFAKKGRLVPRAVQMVPYRKQWRFDGVGTIPARDGPALSDVPPPEKAAQRATG